MSNMIRNHTFLFILSLVLAASMLPTTTQAHVLEQGDAPTLLTNSNFENRLNGWQSCGAAALSDTQASGPTAAHSGRYAAEFGTPAGQDCPPPPDYADCNDGFCNVQAVWQEVTIPASATDVTVSFWYRVDNTDDDDYYGIELTVYLTPDQYPPLYGDEGATIGHLHAHELPGWQLYRHVLTPEELANVRGKTFLLSFLRPSWYDGAGRVRIDDVRVALADERTAAAPLPAALQGDGTRPIAYTRLPEEGEYRHVRSLLWLMDTDGENSILCYPGELNAAKDPAWSPDGRRVAFVDDNSYPPGAPTFTPASALRTVEPNANGCSEPETHYQTISGGSPTLVRRLLEPTWAPDNRRMAVTLFSYTQLAGIPQPGVTDIDVIDTETGESTRLVEEADSPDWNPTSNRIIFDNYDLSSDNESLDGVWELDIAAQPPSQRQLLKSTGPFEIDENPVWAPDGERFVTIRPTASVPFGNEGGSEDSLQALMLFDLDAVDEGRMLLLADHGEIFDPVWSPDGNFILYTLNTGEEYDAPVYNIWWLDVATGKTGPITSDGASFDPAWRPSCPGGCASPSTRSLFLPLVKR